MSIVGAVLAGGASSRFGSDKCALSFGADGVDILTRTVRLLRRVIPEVLVIGRRHGEFPFLPDDIADAGPVGAVTTALRHTGTSCFVLACDLPFMDEATLRLLLKAWEERDPRTLVTAFFHEDTGRKENLVAVYEPSALAYFEPRLRENLLKIAWIVPEEHYRLVPIAGKDKFFNINRPMDAQRAGRLLAQDKHWGRGEITSPVRSPGPGADGLWCA